MDTNIAKLKLQQAERSGFSERRQKMMIASYSYLMSAMMNHPLSHMMGKARGTRTNEKIMGILDRIMSSSAGAKDIPVAEEEDLNEYLDKLLAGINEMPTKNAKDNDLLNGIHMMKDALAMPRAEGGRRRRRRSTRRHPKAKRRSTKAKRRSTKAKRRSTKAKRRA